MDNLNSMICDTCGQNLEYHSTNIIISEKGTYCDIACENIDDIETELHYESLSKGDNKMLESVKMPIRDILKLKYDGGDERVIIEELSMFHCIYNLDTYGMDIKTEELLTERDYVVDTCNDQRSRDLKVIFYKGRPFAIYQYIGKGYTQNEVIFDKTIYGQFLADYFAEYSKVFAFKHGQTIDDIYTISNYNMGYFEFEDGYLVSKPSPDYDF
ncbi:hypothetical protein QO179_23590 [Bacillus stercoris]|nr:hypothetical protein [Bacillus stercoris]